MPELLMVARADEGGIESEPATLTLGEGGTLVITLDDGARLGVDVGALETAITHLLTKAAADELRGAA